MARLILESRVRYPDFLFEAALDLALDGVTALFGPSGSGKSTLLRVIAGLERASAGRVVLDGAVWQDDARGRFVPPHRRAVGMVFQHSGLFPHLSVRSNLLYGFRRTPRSERVIGLDETVALLDLGPLLHRFPDRLSGGERQRVALGRAVLSAPRLLLLDEPLASLDVGRKEEILPFIERLAREFAIPILYVTHAIEEVLRLADIVLLLSDGRVLACGPLEEITNRLDLRAYAGRLDAGSVLRARVEAHDRAAGISVLGFAGGRLICPSIDLAVGAPINVRIRSRDVALSLAPPTGTSILNILPGRVTQIAREPGPHAHVLLDVGAPLWARIMRKSVLDLGLTEGKPVYALIKAVAVDRRSLGRPTEMDSMLRDGPNGGR